MAGQKTAEELWEEIKVLPRSDPRRAELFRQYARLGTPQQSERPSIPKKAEKTLNRALDLPKDSPERAAMMAKYMKQTGLDVKSPEQTDTIAKETPAEARVRRSGISTIFEERRPEQFGDGMKKMPIDGHVKEVKDVTIIRCVEHLGDVVGWDECRIIGDRVTAIMRGAKIIKLDPEKADSLMASDDFFELKFKGPQSIFVLRDAIFDENPTKAKNFKHYISEYGRLRRAKVGGE